MSQNDHNPISNESGSERLRSICDQFKSEWLAGSKPQIEEFLAPVPENSADGLLLELVKLDLELRMDEGENPLQNEYVKRFPEHATDIEKLFRVFKKTSLDERPAFDSADDFSMKEGDSSRRIGPYKLLQKLGEGGMGAVYMADQIEPVRRRVALKLIKSGMDSKQVVARFEAERQALAMMDHQNIAKVLDAGITDEGKPYFAMELVQGMPITKYCDREKLSISDRLSLFVQVCRALQHAHQKGVIHRDIKPSNVLVTQRDGIPLAKVIDFGLAKALQPEHRLTDKTLFTEFGQVCGTLEYMSPEQAEMNEFGLDTRTDVYSLGILLYELLTGSTPLERERLTDAALHQVIKIIITEEPPRPSRRLSDSGEAIAGISEQRRMEPRRLSGILKGELDWVALKALDKDRNRRYDSAGALADDVQKYLDGDVVGARPPSASYRLRKSIRKHKTPFFVGTLFLVLLLVGFASTGIMWLRASKAETAALEEARQARAAEADARYNQVIAENNAYNTNIVLGPRDWKNGELNQLQDRLGRYESRGFEWSYWHRLLNSESLSFLYQGSPEIACFSPDGKTIASDDHGNTVLIWNSTDGEILRRLIGHSGRIDQICYSPNGKTLVTAAHQRDKPTEIKLWDVATGKELLSLDGHTSRVNSIKFNQDATLIVTASDDKTAKLWDAKTGKLLHSFEDHASEVKCAVFGDEDRHVVSVGVNGTVGHWEPMTGQTTESKKLPFPHNRSVMSLSPSGSQLAVAVVTNGTNNTIEFWDTRRATILRTVEEHRGYIDKLAYSNDGKRVVSATQDGTIRVRDVSSGSTICTHVECDKSRVSFGRVSHVTFSSDSEHILSVADGSVKIWDARIGYEPVTITKKIRHGFPNAVIFSPDGKYLVVNNMHGELHVHDAETGLELYSFGDSQEAHKRIGNGFIRVGKNIDSLVFRPDGSHLVSLSGSEEKGSVIQVWDFSSGKHLYDLEKGKSEINEIVFGPSGKHIFGITRSDFGQSDDNPIKVWDARTGQMLRTLVGHSGQVECISPNHDGTRVVTCSADGTPFVFGHTEIRIWDVETGQEITTLRVERPSDLDRLEGDRHIVSFGQNGDEIIYQAFSFGRHVTTSIWSVGTGQQMTQTADLTPDCSSFKWFSPDGKRVISSHRKLGTRVCDTLSGHELLTLGDSQSRRWGNNSACFSPDGKRIAAVTDNNTVTIWDSRPWTDEQRIARRAGLAIKEAREVAVTKADVAKLIRENSSIKEPVRQKALELLKAMRIEKKNELNKQKPTTMILHSSKSS